MWGWRRPWYDEESDESEDEDEFEYHRYEEPRANLNRNRIEDSIIEDDENEVGDDADADDLLVAEPSLKRPRRVTRSTPPPSNLSLLVFDSAEAPRHRVFDAKYLDAEVVRLVLRDWVGADDPDDPNDSVITDRTAISLALVDARFFTSLYHHYRVQQEPNIMDLYRAFRRRFACAAADREVSRRAHRRRRRDVEQDDADDPSTSWFLPHFNSVTGTTVEWSNESVERATWLLDRLDLKVLLFRPGEVIRAPLYVTLLAISGEQLGEQRCSRLAFSLENLPNVATLEIRDCRTAEDAFSSVVSALNHLPHLSRIQLDGTQITAPGWTALTRSLALLPSLTELYLLSTSLSSASCRQLAAALPSAPNLTSLDLARNSIGTDGFRALVSQLRHLTHLSTLAVDSCSIVDDGMCWIEFASVLEHLQRLTTLRLDGNPLRDESAFAIANALSLARNCAHRRNSSPPR